MKDLKKIVMNILNEPGKVKYEGILKIFMLGIVLIILLYFLSLMPIDCIGVCFKSLK